MHRCQTCDKVMVCGYFIDNFFVVVSLLPMTSMIRWGLGKKDQSNRQNTENFLWNGLTGRGKKEKCPNPWEFAFQINLWVLCGFAHQCHNNRTRHFPGRIKYSHNVARWPVGLTVTLLRETEMGTPGKAFPSVIFFLDFRKAAGHAEQEAHEPMRNFDMKWWILEKWFSYWGLESCKHLFCMMYELIVTQK